MGSRFLNPTVPGFLLSQITGLITAGESLVIQAITLGTYFYFNQTVTAGQLVGLQNGANKKYTLPATAKPLTSVHVYYNGTEQQYGVDYTVDASGTFFTFVNIAPISTDVIMCDFTASPV